MLKKNSTKVLAFALAFAMIGGSLSPAVVSAAKKRTKNLQGCTKKVTVKVGKTKKIKVKGIVKSKKFTVKNKKIAKVSKKGIVKGLKAGKTSIKVKVKFWQNGKVKKKNYKVSVIVKGNKKTTKKTVVNNTSTTITNNSSTTNTSNTSGSEAGDKATTIPATATPTVNSSMSFKKDGFEVKEGTLVGVPKDEKEITVPEGTKEIGSYVFQNTKVETVIITNTVIIIQNNAFYGTASLKEVDIPDSVTKIGDNAFEGCKNLVTIKISGKDVEIGTNVVKGCISLESTLPTTKACNHAYSEKIEKEATCTEEGTKVSVCNNCGQRLVEKIAKKKHHFSKKDTSYLKKSANCSSPAVYYVSCSVCGEKGTDTFTSGEKDLSNHVGEVVKGGTKDAHEKCSTCGAILNDDHDMKEIGKVPATCTGPGVMAYICDCGYSYEKEIPKLDHSFDEGIVATPAACETTGTKVYTCTVCGTTKIEVIPATGHDFDTNFTIDRAATTELPGEKSRHCKNCDARTDICKVSMLEKVYNDPEYTWEGVSTCSAISVCVNDENATKRETVSVRSYVENPATCTGPGVTVYVAEFSDSAFKTQIKKVEIPKLSHDYEMTITTPATCETDGIKTFTCKYCNDTKTEAIKATGHVPELDYTVDRAATCKTDGQQSIHCSVCGHSIENTIMVIPATGHVSSNTKTYVKTAATCTEDAIYYKECSICHKRLTGEWIDEGSATGHSYAEPTFAWTEDGSSCKATYSCSVCGNRKIVDCQIKQTITKEPTCTAVGDTIYTATAINPVTKEESTNTKKVTGNISAVGHDYGDPTYTWIEGSSGNTYCKATMCCKTCNHSETESIEAAKKTTAATCTNDGSKVFTATFKNSVFAKQTKTVVLPAKGHSYGNVTYTWSNDKLTCTAKKVCANDASHVETETANAVVTVTKEPTCTNTGSKKYTVTFENEAFDSKWTTETIPALGHDYEGQTITYTFNNGGYVNGAYVDANQKCTATVKCKTCNQAKTETVYTTKIVKTPATCTKKGTVTYTAVFKDSAFKTQTKDVEELAIVAHSYDDGVITKEPTCITKGVKTYTCTVCGATKTEEVAATGHDYQNPTYTYSKGGYNANAGRHIAAYELCYGTSICSKCGAKSSTTVNTVSEIIKASTCSEYGTRRVTAHFTKEPYTDQVIEVSDVAKLAHTFNDGVVTKEPICTTGGTKTYTCTVCGATRAEGISKLGHEYEEEYTVDKEATCINSGTKSRHCKRYASCGSKTDVQVIQALGHTSKVELKDASSEIKKSNNLISVLACDLFLDDSKNYIGIDAEAIYSHAVWNYPDYIFYLEDDYVDDTYTIKAGYYKAMPIVSSNVSGDGYGFFVLGGKKDSTAPTYLGESYKVDTGTCIRCGHKHVYNRKVELKDSSSNIQNTNKYFGEVCSSDFAKDSAALNNTDGNSALYLDTASGYSSYIVYLTESVSVENDYGTTITFDPGYYKLGTDHDGKYYFMDSRFKSDETTSLGASYQVTNTEVCSSCGQKIN